jgi:hypothetical protein
VLWKNTMEKDSKVSRQKFEERTGYLHSLKVSPLRFLLMLEKEE